MQTHGSDHGRQDLVRQSEETRGSHRSRRQKVRFRPSANGRAIRQNAQPPFSSRGSGAAAHVPAPPDAEKKWRPQSPSGPGWQPRSAEPGLECFHAQNMSRIALRGNPK